MTDGPHLDDTTHRETIVGIGAGARWCSDTVIDLGEGHPSSHGLLRLALRLDGERIATAEPIVGHLHRGVEKLFEVRDYRQILALANRHDWHSSYAGELGIALGVEHMLGLEVPTRATWLRTLLAEYTRIVHHLEFLDRMPLPGNEPLLGLHPLRERLLTVLETATGGRMHVMIVRIGGLAQDMPAGWFAQVSDVMAQVRAVLPELTEALAHDRVTTATRGVALLDQDTARAYGVLGPGSRAAGIDVDLRRDEPYLAYGELFVPGGPGRVVTRDDGDALARHQVLAGQIEVSVDLVEACIDRLLALPPESIDVRLPKVLRVPEGAHYVSTEAPAGHAGYLIVSHGEKTPWRLAMRTPSFAAASALSTVLVGTRVRDLAAALGSFYFVIGDIDR
ncbi:NADH dehydrogenase subunit D [Austwickia chelonae]|uniref:NADH-quinone oxidoreductase subunit D n=1 Tax=Austwickia chelonae NBRC 105200 TaxID=1184607 RepID=K6VNJ1_9MICO|nr:NADH-quinone oxidoreductase subunit D [Austwickia chelonae]GAB76950.1 NADH-quinone oxidoreductase subunit D [Austwickia chelonae NBRC 105200]SEW32650.1 NADH dehydrogenase subunit D [Austwickia chelonae]